MAAPTTTLDFLDIVIETDAAWLIKFSKKQEEWLPKSQCVMDELNKEIEVPEWLAHKHGLI